MKPERPACIVTKRTQKTMHRVELKITQPPIAQMCQNVNTSVLNYDTKRREVGNTEDHSARFLLVEQVEG